MNIKPIFVHFHIGDINAPGTFQVPDSSNLINFFHFLQRFLAYVPCNFINSYTGVKRWRVKVGFDGVSLKNIVSEFSNTVCLCVSLIHHQEIQMCLILQDLVWCQVQGAPHLTQTRHCQASVHGLLCIRAGFAIYVTRVCAPSGIRSSTKFPRR